ncbi:MAG: hypothetical protein C5B51_15015 [Terriglobia bacterium]|nr:MAG: hypothetical protein C5B51_15015 [Terriglobia bacterium]
MKRILLAGLLSGIAVFAWESVTHLASPLGQAGIKPLSNEQAVLTSLKDNIEDAGFYFFPAPTPQNAGQQGVTGIMVVNPNGSLAMAPGQLITQAGADIIAMILAAALLVAVPIAGFGKRVLFVTAMGLLPVLRSELPYWNWYGFPSMYLIAQTVIQVGAFAVGGLVLAKMIKSDSSVPRAARKAA